ncbi:cytochrome P450 [Podospora appendiculata]|uniref:Cytochrome P450 n=1 Tax=Podospora appendiculata TaxID=314037 RepID=A0AAE0XJ98_9PEZI|nr:cytochrome P450 [Podospora appendiculata]
METKGDMGLVYCIGAAVALLSLAMAFSGSFSLRGGLSHLPGPWYSKYTDVVLTYHWLRGNRAIYVHHLHARFGPVVRISPHEADLCDVNAKRQIYSTKGTFVKSSFYKLLVGNAGESVFTARDVDIHRKYRRMLSQPLSESSLKTVEPIVRSRVDLAIQRMGEVMQTQGVVDVFQWAFFMATDVIGELTFGESFRTLEKGEPTEYVQTLQKTAEAGSIRIAFPRLVKFLLQYRIPTPIAALNVPVEVFADLRKYSVESLQRYYRLVKADDGVNLKQTLFTKVFKAEEEDRLTFGEIVDNARTYLIAGSDTTAVTLTYLLWSVCSYKRVQERLAEEVRVALPADDDAFADHDLRQLPYLNAVIEETLRLYSAAPSGLPRVVPAGGADLAGWYFPPGAIVTSQAYSLHRAPETFHDPEVFNPERWLDGNVTRDMQDAFMPFGGGSRVCIGSHLARMELRLATTLFFRAFPHAKVSSKQNMSSADMVPAIFFILSPQGKRCLIEAC